MSTVDAKERMNGIRAAIDARQRARNRLVDRRMNASALARSMKSRSRRATLTRLPD